MVYAPVWKDTYYTSGDEVLNYTIEYGGEVIFSGKAQRMPNDILRININRVCQNYLRQNIATLFGSASSETNPNAIGTFYLKSGTTTLETYMFLYCYDYDFDWTGRTGTTLSNPICNDYAAGMRVLSTRINSSRNVVTTALDANGTVCADYGLYYVNARGGWDAFAIQGTGLKKESITQYTTDRSFNNTTREFEANRYMSEIKTSYELNTHYLSDEQSANLAKNLISSNLVYLHNLKDGTIKPVIITDNSVSYQTYQTNGKRLSQYKINVTESQSKLRR